MSEPSAMSFSAKETYVAGARQQTRHPTDRCIMRNNTVENKRRDHKYAQTAI